MKDSWRRRCKDSWRRHWKDSWGPQESSAKLTASASRTTTLVRGVKTPTAMR